MAKVNDWKIGIRISGAFALVILIYVAMCWFAFNRVRDIDQKAVIVSDNHVPSVIALSSASLRVNREVELLRLHAASTNQQEMADLEVRLQAYSVANTEDYKKYESYPSDDLEGALYAKVKQNREDFHARTGEILKESRIGTPQTNAIAQQMLNTQLVPLAEKYTDAIQAVVDYNNKGSVTGLNEVRKAVTATIQGLGIGLVLAISLAVLISMFIVRSITVPLSKAVSALDRVAGGDLTVVLDVDTQDEVGQMARALNKAVERLNSTMQEVADSAANASSSSQQLAAAAEAIASGAQEQAASLEETSASLEEITAAVRQSADNAQQASQLAAGSKDSALQGQDVVAKAITAMSEINASSAKISDIISTIDEIAFQTNLLAVNAAVEAARAGDEGRGFAVVASEVRSLAQRSAVAAKEIKVLIQDSLQKVTAGSGLVNRSGETLQGIVGSVKRVTDIVGEMAASATEQSTGIEQVNTAMTQMDQVTQSNSAQTEELSATAESLSEQAGHLMELVSTFTLSQGEKNQRERQVFQPHAAAPAKPAPQPSPVQRLKSAVRPLAKTVRSSVAAKSNSNPRGTKRIKSLEPVLATAIPVGPIVDDASFQEF